MNQKFEYITTLQYRVRSLSQRLDKFESGEIYQKMDSDFKKMIRHYEYALAQKDLELSKSHSETITVRKYWSEIMDDVEKEDFQGKRTITERNSDTYEPYPRSRAAKGCGSGQAA